ncbi:hypothetical protein ACHAXT_001398 [Thalassiosira profunda]
MGNLLGSPITEKDTHVGVTHDSNGDQASSSDGGGLQYGISSMQGWRIHMEDAHIAQPFLFAEKLKEEAEDKGHDSGSGAAEDNDAPNKKTATTSTEEGEKKTDADQSMKDSGTANKYVRIPLPNHSLFAVFDGHGGSFAAEYAARNLLRVLCRSDSFCQYAEKWRGRETYLRAAMEKLSIAGDASSEEATKATMETTEEDKTPEKMDDRQRLQQLQKRGRESDEKVKQIKEQVKRHFDGEVNISVAECAADTASNSSNPSCDGDIDASDSTDLQVARATYDHELMTLLEKSLRDAFVDLDAEILRAVQGDQIGEANAPYGLGYDLSQHSLDVCIGHLPTEAPPAADAIMGDVSSEKETGTDPKADHPSPSDDEDAGTTAVVVMTTPRWIACANAGDSRAVYARSGGRAVPLSYDHKPDDEDEERRIREAGGYVSGGRVEGDLAVSRGLGDYRFKELDSVMSGAAGENERRNATVLQRQIASTLKGGEDDVPMLKPSEQKVSPVPDIIVQNRDPKEDEFIVIACDGIWDVQTNQECVRMVVDIFGEGESDLGLVCEEILDLCLIKGSKDNMTAAVIKFPKQTIGKGGGVAARRERRGASATNEGQGGDEGQVHLRRVYNPYIPPAQREQEEEEEEDGEET